MLLKHCRFSKRRFAKICSVKPGRHQTCSKALELNLLVGLDPHADSVNNGDKEEKEEDMTLGNLSMRPQNSEDLYSKVRAFVFHAFLFLIDFVV